jgi:hypothetical protein
MKLGSLTSTYADASNYSFQYDPKIVNMTIGSKKQLIDLPLVSISSYLDNEAVTPLSINLVGTVYGTDKVTYLNKLSYWCFSKGMKKLYLDDTYFIFVLGKGLKPTKDGKRYNFRDYVASFECPIPFIYGVTQKSCTYTTIAGTAVTLNNSTMGTTNYFSNTGYGPAHIQRITVKINSGTLTKVEIGDKVLSGSDVDGDNILTWDGSLASGTLNLYLIYEYGSKGNMWYCFEAVTPETVSGDRSISGDNPESGPRITGNTADQSFSLKTTGAACDVTFYWYNSNYGGW